MGDSGWETICTSAARSPSHEVEGEEPSVAERALDVVPEDPEIEHVPDDVQEPSV